MNKRSDRAQAHLFAVSEITSSQTIGVEQHFVQKLHSSAIALQQILDLFSTGSQVATLLVTSHAYHIYRELFINP